MDLLWDGSDHLRQINQSGTPVFTAGYNGDGVRVSKQDAASGTYPTRHNYTWGLGGVLYDAFNSTTYTPGVSQRVNDMDQLYQVDWLGSTRDLTGSASRSIPDRL